MDEESGYVFKSVLLVATFLLLTPVALVTSVFALITVSSSGKPEVMAASTQNLIGAPKPGVRVYASLPNSVPSVAAEAKEADARTEIISQYLASYNSPLESYASFLVQSADRWGLDFRLTTAIAQQESSLCKYIPPETYNCWGWGIHSRGTLGFRNYEEAIDAVSQGLKNEYIDKGYLTVEEIMNKYTPLSNGSWAEGVTRFMEEME